jgi:hypothetical protein
VTRRRDIPHNPTDGRRRAHQDVERRLRQRDDVGDVELGDQLASRLGGPAPFGRAVRADLDQVAHLLSGDAEAGGWLDTETGACLSEDDRVR